MPNPVRARSVLERVQLFLAPGDTGATGTTADEPQDQDRRAQRDGTGGSKAGLLKNRSLEYLLISSIAEESWALPGANADQDGGAGDAISAFLNAADAWGGDHNTVPLRQWHM